MKKLGFALQLGGLITLVVAPIIAGTIGVLLLIAAVTAIGYGATLA